MPPPTCHASRPSAGRVPKYFLGNGNAYELMSTGLATGGWSHELGSPCKWIAAILECRRVITSRGVIERCQLAVRPLQGRCLDHEVQREATVLTWLTVWEAPSKKRGDENVCVVGGSEATASTTMLGEESSLSMWHQRRTSKLHCCFVYYNAEECALRQRSTYEIILGKKKKKKRGQPQPGGEEQRQGPRNLKQEETDRTVLQQYGTQLTVKRTSICEAKWF